MIIFAIIIFAAEKDLNSRMKIKQNFDLLNNEWKCLANYTIKYKNSITFKSAVDQFLEINPKEKITLENSNHLFSYLTKHGVRLDQEEMMRLIEIPKLNMNLVDSP